MALLNRELNRKILEELELNKKLLKQGVVSAPNSNPTLSGNSNSSTNIAQTSLSPDLQAFNSTQRSAFNLAYSQSFGYYIPQDSSFGNVILPVLPRFDKK